MKLTIPYTCNSPKTIRNVTESGKWVNVEMSLSALWFSNINSQSNSQSNFNITEINRVVQNNV